MFGVDMMLKSLGITPEMMAGLQKLIVQTAQRLEQIEQNQIIQHKMLEILLNRTSEGVALPALPLPRQDEAKADGTDQ